MSDDEANIPKYSKYGRHHLEDISHNNHDKTKLRLTPSGRDLSCVSQRQFHLIGSATKFSRSETSTSPLRQDVPRDIKCIYFPLRSAAPATCHDLLTKASSSAVSFFELENWKRMSWRIGNVVAQRQSREIPPVASTCQHIPAPRAKRSAGRKTLGSAVRL